MRLILSGSTRASAIVQVDHAIKIILVRGCKSGLYDGLAFVGVHEGIVSQSGYSLCNTRAQFEDSKGPESWEIMATDIVRFLRMSMQSTGINY